MHHLKNSKKITAELRVNKCKCGLEEKMAKRVLFLIVSIFILIFACACKKEKVIEEKDTVNTQIIEETDYDDEDVVKDDAYYFSDLSTDRYDGYNFRILTRKGRTWEVYFDEPQDDIVDDAIYRRNKAVEEKYGIKISVSESANSNTDTSALNAILAGDDAYDLIFTHTFSAFSYAVQGACYNINEISTIHTEKPWWMRDIANGCTVGGRLFVLDGDITLSIGSAMCLLFNKNIFDELGFDYPYEMVKDGDWTFDELSYLAKKGARDLNGNGVIEPEYDRFGFATGCWSYPIGLIYTGGERVYTVDDVGDVNLTVYSNKTVEMFDEFFSLMKADGCAIDTVGGAEFIEGRVMMFAGSIGDSKSFRNMDDEFGILPYPKFDDDDEYSSVINGGPSLVLIPLTVSDAERTGAITEALCAYGSRDVIPAYYEKALKTKYSRDDESEEMIDIV